MTDGQGVLRVGRMPKSPAQWKVLPHGPIEKLSDNIWWVQGSLPGMSLKRVMTLVRVRDGRLVVHNGIALAEDAMQRIEAWGTPAFLAVPSGWHRLDAAAYKQRYPSLRVFVPKGARGRVEQVVTVDGTYEEFPHSDEVRFEPVPGLADREGAMIARSSDGVSVVLNDAVFNMDRKRDPLGFMFTTLLGSAPGPRVSRLAKLTLIKDKRSFRTYLEQLAETPELTRLIVAHEKVARGSDAAAALRRAAQYL